MAIFDNLKYVTERIQAAALRSGRQADEVSLLAVTKTVAAERIRAAAALGLTLIGENRVQEAWAKSQQLTDLPLSWHMIGHLQSNKVKRALQFATLIESVDSLHIAREIDREAAAQAKQSSVSWRSILPEKAGNSASRRMGRRLWPAKSPACPGCA